MMAGAYTLSKNGHVRGDVLYSFFMPRTQAWVDLVLYHAVFYSRRGGAGLGRLDRLRTGTSWAINEHSNITSDADHRFTRSRR